MSKKVISFHYTLTDKTGKMIDTSKGREALAFMEGAGQIIPGLEKELIVLKKGDKKIIQVPAAEAYGVRDESMIIKVERHELPAEDVKMGDRFRGGQDSHSPVFTVMELSETEATLDGNHSLAGTDLTFDVELTEVREATAEELSHGHAHGEHGHSH